MEEMRDAKSDLADVIAALDRPGMKRRLEEVLVNQTVKRTKQQLTEVLTIFDQACFNGAVKKEFRSMDLAAAGANLLRYYRLAFGQKCKFYHAEKVSNHGGTPAFSFVFQCLQLIDPSLTVSNLNRLTVDIERLVPQIIDLRPDQLELFD